MKKKQTKQIKLLPPLFLGMSFFTFFGGLVVTLTPSVVSFIFFVMSNNLLIVFTLGGYVLMKAARAGKTSYLHVVLRVLVLGALLLGANY